MDDIRSVRHVMAFYRPAKSSETHQSWQNREKKELIKANAIENVDKKAHRLTRTTMAEIDLKIKTAESADSIHSKMWCARALHTKIVGQTNCRKRNIKCKNNNKSTESEKKIGERRFSSLQFKSA